MLDRVGGISDGSSAWTMAHKQHRLPRSIAAERPQHGGLVQGIQVARGLVEQHEGGVVQEHAREAQPLALAA